MNFLISDIINYLVILLLLFFLFQKKYLDINLTIVLALTSASTFFMFGFLFEANDKYFGDADFYQWSVIRARFFEYEKLYWTVDIRISSILYSFIPIPLLDSPNSLGFICKFIFICIIAYLNKNLKIDKIYIYLLILYPSAVLYTGIGLKDTLVLFLMVISLTGIIKNNYFFIFIPLIFLFNIKAQNALIIVLVVLSYNLLCKKNITLFLLQLSILLILCIPFVDRITEYFAYAELNRIYMYFLDLEGVPKDEIIPLRDDIFIFFDILKGNISFFFKPFIFDQKNNFFETFQAFENLLIVIFTFILFIILAKKNIYRCIFWYSHLFFAGGLYGLIVSNAGSLVRYKFAIIISFFIVMLYDFKINVDNKIKKI